MTSAAFFDLDKTLLQAHSGDQYVRYAYRRKEITLRQLVGTACWLVLQDLGMIDVDWAFQKAATIWKGRAAQPLREEVDVWFNSELSRRISPFALRELDNHRAAGRPLVLLTNSTNYIADTACRAWKLDDFLANDILTDEQGQISGITTPVCYGHGKVRRAEEWAKAHGVKLNESFFYSDSFSDVPMLSRVGFPFAVNPDRRLRKTAERHGWPVLNWN